MKNLQQNGNHPKKGYKQINEELDIAQEMFDNGSYSLDEYKTILLELKKEYDELVRERAFRFSINNLKSGKQSRYKQINDGLDMAQILFDKGEYTVDEYEAVLSGLWQDFLKLDREKRSRS
ncbi:hypothetical protein [Flagellimonas sp.]|jgi:hypothetical protein|uniref:hypothetical protein n=1 Tax=Flagellimonas sp. TaxID=2058762 RepID=UPI003BAC4BA3